MKPARIIRRAVGLEFFVLPAVLSAISLAQAAEPQIRLQSSANHVPRYHCRHPKLDFADTHFYLRPSDHGRLRDEVDAVLDRTRWLREQAPNKPAHLGEFGLADEKWRPTEAMQRRPELVDVHNALWASALSGASGTAMFWWWERLDQRNVYPAYRPLSAFIAGVPWTSGAVQPLRASLADERLCAVGLQVRQQAWLWLFHRAASWANVVLENRAPPVIPDAALTIQTFPPGVYRIQWSDPDTGQLLREERQTAIDGELRLRTPEFSRDIACKINP